MYVRKVEESLNALENEILALRYVISDCNRLLRLIEEMKAYLSKLKDETNVDKADAEKFRQMKEWLK